MLLLAPEPSRHASKFIVAAKVVGTGSHDPANAGEVRCSMKLFVFHQPQSPALAQYAASQLGRDWRWRLRSFGPCTAVVQGSADSGVCAMEIVRHLLFRRTGARGG